MSNHGERRWLKAPSPAMIVALIALVFAMSGTAVAATQLVNGDNLIKKGTLSGNRLRTQTVSGSKIVASSLGKVPSAARADVAQAVAAGAVGTTQVGAIPAVRVYAAAGTVSIPNASWRELSYPSEDFDVGNMHDAVNPSRLTAPVAGKYLIMASCRWPKNTQGRRVMGLYKNGGSSITQNQVSPYYETTAPAGLDVEQTVQSVTQLAAGDYVTAAVYQDSGGALLLPGEGANLNWVSMVWIAP
jgi:hypothetical protein